MKGVNGKIWRNSASLVLLNKQSRDSTSCRSKGVNYDVLLQTRTVSASFPNSVVFPGGVLEAADESADWFRLLHSFGYSRNDFDAFHQKNTPVTPIFQPDPVKRHVSLRIAAIRETFEELGILICSTKHKENKSSLNVDVNLDIDVKYWQEKVSKNPGELLNLCREYNCYPDIWSLYYWSNWLTPTSIPKRFDTAFFLAALGKETPQLHSSSEVTKVKWADPQEILEKNLRLELELYPPQVYELHRFIQFHDIEELLQYASKRNSRGLDVIFPIIVEAKDGKLHVYPGDDLYPTNLTYNETNIVHSDKTILELREFCDKLHRLEVTSSHGLKTELVFRNYSPTNHINMGDRIIPSNLSLHKNVK